ncbi:MULTISPECIES: hypothetical protein [unclassified Methylobacterium]|uniref:hypothetical protein n=1 Tax=unclassified Methylobacterium TaxID=2615210 RepID=UPI0006F41F96|nr:MULTISPECIES: hypothetical protein [unclassified Methylobacterium]KQO52156.1 hypothetical protein ASF24_06040 [Methylobacterium sp. Leaf86]KQO98996.1 hypothetical protein ASF32_14115 [Methylobacterium sp. Leaf91]
MTSAANTNMANISRPGHSYTVFSEARMMQKVGEDLRFLYGDMIDRSAPDELLRLAALIDERRNETEAGR